MKIVIFYVNSILADSPFQGMAFLHSLDRELPRYYLNSKHVMIDSVSENELCARLNMADAKFTFMDRAKSYHPQWMAPEV